MKSLITLVIFLGSFTSTYAATVLPIELDVINEINLVRTSNGLNTLAFDSVLFEASRFHADDMAITRQLSHTLSDGTTWWDNYENFGYTAPIPTGNLIGLNFPSGEAFVSALMSSTEHRDMILNEGAWASSNWEGIGVGWSDGYFSVGLGTVEPVPVPAAVWLFGSGLLGLFGVAKRKVRS